MRVIKEGVEYIGTPGEIARLFSRINVQTEHRAEPDFLPSPENTNKTLADVIDLPTNEFVDAPGDDGPLSTDELRKKLAEDPAYNPFGGVVPPPDTEREASTPVVGSYGLGNEDTGVKPHG